jgi:uncharacterized protein HemY
MNPTTMAWVIIIVGIILLAIGLFLLFASRIPLLGKLPGDIYIKRGNFSFYFPLTTCIIISIIMTLIVFLIKKYS